MEEGGGVFKRLLLLVTAMCNHQGLNLLYTFGIRINLHLLSELTFAARQTKYGTEVPYISSVRY